MITTYSRRAGGIVVAPLLVKEAPARPPGLVWIDLLEPSAEEKALVEEMTGISIPTAEQMHEIEPSSRLYQKNDALFMTASVLHRSAKEEPETRAMTFVLTGGVMISIRHSTPQSFEIFRGRVEQQPLLTETAEVALLGLLDALVDRIADALENVDANVNAMARTILSLGEEPPSGSKDHKEELRQIGMDQVRCSKADESLISLARVLTFLDSNLRQGGPKHVRMRIKSLQRDVQSLSGYAARLTDRLEFMLEATLGAINVEQTNIIKMFSVVAVVFMPPTLIASIYGMNFESMPELDSPWGYPIALGVMLVSAILPYALFKLRGWL